MDPAPIKIHLSLNNSNLWLTYLSSENLKRSYTCFCFLKGYILPVSELAVAGHGTITNSSADFGFMPGHVHS